MKLIRSCIFETNSSSSHALTIVERTEDVAGLLPKDTSFTSYGLRKGISCDDYNRAVLRLETQIGKLDVIVSALVGYLESKEDIRQWDCELKKYKVETKGEFFDIVNNDMRVKALKECIRDYTGSTLTIVSNPEEDRYAPYVVEVYDEDDYAFENLLSSRGDKSIDKLTYEDYVKIFRKLLFDSNIIIEYSDTPYGWEERIEDYESY